MACTSLRGFGNLTTQYGNFAVLVQRILLETGVVLFLLMANIYELEKLFGTVDQLFTAVLCLIDHEFWPTARIGVKNLVAREDSSAC